MRLLYFARPAGWDFFSAIIGESLLKDWSKHYITEFYELSKKLENCHYLINSPVRDRLYTTMLFSDEEVYDIIIRDRLLVTLPFRQAVSLVWNATGQIAATFDKVNPDIAVVKDLDTFTNDIFLRVAQKRNIFSFYLVAGPKGTMKFYNYNVPYIRKTPYSELNLFDFMAERKGNIYRKLPKDSLFHRMKMMYGHYKQKYKHARHNHPDSMHWNTHARYLRHNVKVAPHFNLGDRHSGFYHTLDDIPENGKTKVYISLHFYPEATINYFATHNSLIWHDSIVVELIERFQDAVHFVVKEHPEMYNKRDLALYKKIKSFRNTTLLHPYIPAYDVVEASDIVLSWAGSIGWEAPFLGKKTLSVFKPYYVVEGVENYFRDATDLLENFLVRCKNISYDNEHYCKSLNHIFQSFSYPGIPLETYDTPENRGDIVQSINSFLEEHYF